MSKGVAIPYIVALILGIVVIGLLGYWFLVLSGQAGGTATSSICSAKLSAWCQEWSTNGFQGNCPSTEDSSSCQGSVTAATVWQRFALGCTGPNMPPKDSSYCRALFGQTITTTT